MTPGRKPSSRTSASAASRRKRSPPSADLRFSVMLRLLRARNGMPAPKGSPGAAMTRTSIPRSARSVEQNGPGSCRDRSNIFRWPRGDTRAERSVDPAVHGADAGLGDQQVVPDRVAAPFLDGTGRGDEAEDVGRLRAVVGLGVRVNLEVPDRHAIVPGEA